MTSEIYPGASTSRWYSAKYPGDKMTTNTIVWHSTEGTSLPDYSGGSVAPTLTAVPDFKTQTIRWYQHFDFNESARALVNAPGGVETNTLNVAQVEVVGTCDPTTHKKWGSTPHLYMPELPDWAIRQLAAFAAWAHDVHGVPYTAAASWKAYPSSYGSNGVRMSAGVWQKFKGHCGHQHVPENDHGDPGAFPIGNILSVAKASTTASAPPTTKPKPAAFEPFPGAAWFKVGRRSPIVAAMHARLVAVGCNHYQSTSNKDVIGSGDVASYEAWQRKCGYSGAAATWPPGKTTWDKLHVPNS